MIALAFSGGKDSMACLHLTLREIDVAIYVDTGKTYPETGRMVEYARQLVRVVTVHSNRDEQNTFNGIPADTVPVDYTQLGHNVSGQKPVTIQSYLDCCFQNISLPLFLKAKELGVTGMIYGQRIEDGLKSPARNGDLIGGIRRIHPIERWSRDDVMRYLNRVMDVPEHYNLNQSSLDCYDCTAFRRASADRIEYTRKYHPGYYREYQTRAAMVREALINSGYMETSHGA